MTKKFMLATVAMFLAVSARALSPVTIETEYTPGFLGCVITNATSGTCDPCGYGSVGYSSSTANCIGFDWQVMVKGSTGTFTISYTTKTYSSHAVSPNPFTDQAPGNLAGSGAVVMTSPSITIPPGLTQPLGGEFRALTINPYFTFSNLSALATTYVYVEYGIQKRP